MGGTENIQNNDEINKYQIAVYTKNLQCNINE